MGYFTIAEGLTIQIPTLRTENWEETLRTECFIKISEHDHSGNGKGLPISTGSIEDDALNDLKINLRNNQYLRGKNNAGDGDVNIIRVGTDDVVEVAPHISDSLTTDAIITKGAGTINNNQVGVGENLISFVPDSGESYELHYELIRDGASDLYEKGVIEVIDMGADYGIAHEKTGNAGLTITVDATGTIEYLSTDNTDTASTLRYTLKRFK